MGFDWYFLFLALQSIPAAAFLLQCLAQHSQLKTILIQTSASWRYISTAELFGAKKKKKILSQQVITTCPWEQPFQTKCPPAHSLCWSPCKHSLMRETTLVDFTFTEQAQTHTQVYSNLERWNSNKRGIILFLGSYKYSEKEASSWYAARGQGGDSHEGKRAQKSTVIWEAWCPQLHLFC